MPSQEFVLHFKTVFSAEEIRIHRKKIFRVLTDNGLEAVVSIELTRGKDGKPNGCVHFTILTDDPRSEKELRKLLETACERQGLVNKKDFCITHEDLPDGYGRFNYFTKYGEKYFDKVILFQKGLLKSGKNLRTLQKFYTIGQWFKKGRGKGKIWDEIKAFMQEKYGTDIKETGNSDEIDLSGIGDEIDADGLSNEVPFEFGSYTDLDRAALRDEFDIDLDKYADESVSTNGFYVPGVGRFHKFTSGQWIRIEDELSVEPPVQGVDGEVNSNTADGDRMPIWNECPLDGHYLPQTDGIRDRRRDWQRFKYSIAFRQ